MREIAPYVAAFILAALTYWGAVHLGAGQTLGLLCALLVVLGLGSVLEYIADEEPPGVQDLLIGGVAIAVVIYELARSVGFDCLWIYFFDGNKSLLQACVEAVKWRFEYVLWGIGMVAVGGALILSGLISAALTVLAREDG